MKKRIAKILKGISEVSAMYIAIIILNKFDVLYISNSFGAVITFFLIAVTASAVSDMLDEREVDNENDRKGYDRRT